MKYFNPETKTFKLFNALYNGSTKWANPAAKSWPSATPQKLVD